MPFVDYKLLFSFVSLGEVLRLIGYQRAEPIGFGLRGPCPLGCSTNSRAATLSWPGNWWYCHRCKKGSKPFKLYLAVKKIGPVEAASELCELLNIPVEKIIRRRGTGAGRRKRIRRDVDMPDDD